MKVMLDEGAYLPERAHPDDAGLDLKTPKSFWLFAGNYRKIDTGVHVEIQKGMVGLITSKSGLMAKGITCRGTIDAALAKRIRAKKLWDEAEEELAMANLKLQDALAERQVTG